MFLSGFMAGHENLYGSKQAIVALRYKLQKLAYKWTHAPANVLCDNQSVVLNTSTHVESTIQCKQNAIAHH